MEDLVYDRENLQNVTAEWIQGLRPWKLHVVLTFRDCPSFEKADGTFRRLIQVLNRDAFGDHYTKKVGHSYFAYVRALEYQVRMSLHFHMLVDRPLNFDLVHRWWNAAAGFAWIDQTHDIESTCRYVSKYITKSDQQLKIYVPKENKVPHIAGGFKPYWWIVKS
jgi:hypothetical protein